VDLQRQYNVNEFNTIENGFADEFVLAQRNLLANEAAFAAGDVFRRYCSGFYVNGQCRATNSASGTIIARVPTFAYFGSNTGTSPLPLMMAYFNSMVNYLPNDPGKYGGAGGAAAANSFGTNFANSTLTTALSPNAPNIFAFNGSSFENNATRRTNATDNRLPINFFYVNPTTIGGGSFTVDNSNKTWYDSGVIEVRRRMAQGLRIGASYVFSKAQANAYASSSALNANFSQREDGLELAKNVQVFDIRHQFKFDATWDIPLGKGQPFLSNSNWFVNALVGGWTILPTIKWQSGSPFSLGNVQLVGMTKKELQKAVGVYKGADAVTFLPDDIILNTQRAFDINVGNTSSATLQGYGTQYGGGGPPEGRFIAPAGYGNCVQKYSGTCGFNNLILYGPSFFKLDATVAKRFKWGERRSVELRVTSLDVLNAPNFRIGGWNADTATVSFTAAGIASFGVLGPTSAYQDVSTTNDLGGRQIDLMLRINF
jgi:hypothetical protein